MINKISRKHIIACTSVLTILPLISCNVENASQEEPDRPNIIFILADDMGKEWVSGYGADDILTPNLDKMAETGMQFNNVYSMPQCTPSRVTLLTGQYPYNHGWINHFDVPRWGHGAKFDPAMNPTYAQFLRDAGYKTAATGKWQVNDFRLEPDLMVQAGFDDYFMWTGAEGGNVEASQKRYWDPYIHSKEGSKTYPGEFGPDLYNDFIIDFLRENKDEPMAIYYAMTLPHGPLVHTPAEPDVTEKMDKHKAMIHYVDILVGKLLNELDELGIRQNTIVFFTTDNGTAGSIVGSRNGINIRGGKTFLTENGVNAPMIVSCPGTIPSGTISNALVDFTDMLSTFAEIAGVPVPDNYQTDGFSFYKTLLDPSKENDRKWVLAMGSLSGNVGEDGMIKNWFTFRDRAFRDKQYKVYVDTLKQINRIFDISNDIMEENNLIDIHSEEISDVLDYYQKIIDGLPDEDANPKYEKLDSIIYSVPIEKLEKSFEKTRTRSNMSPRAEK